MFKGSLGSAVKTVLKRVLKVFCIKREINKIMIIMTGLILWAWFEFCIVHVLFFPYRYRDHSKGGHFRFKLRAKRCDRSCNQLLT